MKELLLQFPQQIQEGYNLGSLYRTDNPVDNILILGLGGSAISGELLEVYLREYLIPVTVCRSYTYTGKIDTNTLVFVISYSGTSEETVSCLKSIMSQTDNIIIITSGGQLLEIAQSQKYTTIVCPKGIPQRSAIGYFFSIMLAVLEQSGRIESQAQQLKDLIRFLETGIDHAVMQSLAKCIRGCVPIVYGSDDIEPVLRNIKMKFNENSKTQSFFNVFPELNHNEMVGFTNLVMLPFFLIFQKQSDDVRVLKRMKVFGDLMKEKGLSVEYIQIPGNSVLEWIFAASYMGDWLSYYLALEYGIDPEPVEMVQRFKKLLSE